MHYANDAYAAHTCHACDGFVHLVWHELVRCTSPLVQVLRSLQRCDHGKNRRVCYNEVQELLLH